MKQALTVVLISLVAVAGASGGAAPPAKLLFQHAPSFGFDTPYGLGIANLDGTGYVDLTASVVQDHHAALEPAWAPDGSSVVFALYRTSTSSAFDTAGEIYVVGADGSGMRRLTNDASGTISNEKPVWSSDGARIAWLKHYGDGHGSDVWVMNADGSGQRAVTRDGASGAANTNVAWSADGTRLAWLKRVGKTEEWQPDANVWVAAADGSDARALTSSSQVVRGPLWQPDGQLLLYGEGAATNALHVVDPAVGPPGVTIASPQYAIGGGSEPFGADPVWSSRGDRIAWAAYTGVEVATPTGDVRQVEKLAAERVAWSPDESKLAFVHGQEIQSGRDVCGCDSTYVVDIAGGVPHIVSGREGVPDFAWDSPVWWPDSARLSVGGEFGIENVNADGTCLRPFPNPANETILDPLLRPGAATLPPPPQCVALESTGGFAVDTAPVGAPPHVALTVTNRGNATATEVTLLVFASSGSLTSTTPGCVAGAVLHCALGSLAGLASVKVEVDATAPKAGTFTLSTTLSSAEEPAVRTKTSIELLSCTTVGTDASETIVGGPGRDTICGFAGDDTIEGLGGNDWIDAGIGHDTVYGGAGNDVIFGRLGHDHLYGGPGNDTIDGGNGPDVIDGGPGNDHLTGGLYPDVLLGGPGNDVIDAADGYQDTVDCGPGRDTVYVERGIPDHVKNCERVIRR